MHLSETILPMHTGSQYTLLGRGFSPQCKVPSELGTLNVNVDDLHGWSGSLITRLPYGPGLMIPRLRGSSFITKSRWELGALRAQVVTETLAHAALGGLNWQGRYSDRGCSEYVQSESSALLNIALRSQKWSNTCFWVEVSYSAKSR